MDILLQEELNKMKENEENCVSGAFLDAKLKKKIHSFRPVLWERIFLKSLPVTGMLVVVLIVCIFLTLAVYSLPSIKELGVSFIWESVWNPVEQVFGGLPFLVGTLLTSFLALLMAIPFSLAIAILLGDFYPKGLGSGVLKGAIDLTAAVPSVIFGFWGFFVLVPVIRTLEIKLGLPATGVGVLPAALILAIMVIPYVASISTQIIRMTPTGLKEGAYALGATRWEVLKYVILPSARSGIGSGLLLALGRAVGETMAVTMVIGNANRIPEGIFSPGNTMASAIANEFSEADNPIYFSALIELGLFLFVLTFLLNLIGKRIIKRKRKTI